MSFDSVRRRESRNKSSVNNSEMATVTSPGMEIAANGAGEYRDIVLIGPQGVNWNPNLGSDVQLLKSWSSGANMAALGVPVKGSVEPGEIEIFAHGSNIHLKESGEMKLKSKSGASIELKDDGTVLINNHFLINVDGTTEVI